MKHLILAHSILFTLAAAHAQPNPDTLWAHSYDINEGSHAYITDVIDTQTGFTLFGAANDGFSWNGFIMQIAPDGSQTGFHSFAPFVESVPLRAMELDDGGCVIVGYTLNWQGGDFDVYISRTDSTGNSLWAMSFDVPYMWEGLIDVCRTLDNNLMAVGFWESMTSDTNGYMLKLNLDGDTLWSRRFPGSGVSSVFACEDGGYVIASDRLRRLNSVGETLWTRSSSEVIQWNDLELLSDSTFFAIGQLDSDIVLRKYNLNGDSLEQTVWGGDNEDAPKRLLTTTNDEIIVFGSTKSFGHGALDVLLLKLDSSGAPLWYQTYGLASNDLANAVAMMDDGSYLVVGQRDYAVWAVRTGPDVNISPDDQSPAPNQFSLSAYPNPFNSTTQLRFELFKPSHVELSVINTLGQRVAVLADEEYTAGFHTVVWDAREFASGVYFSQLRAENQSRVMKTVLMR